MVSAKLLIFSISLFSMSWAQYLAKAREWYYGGEGMNNVTVVAQSKIPCDFLIGIKSSAGLTFTEQLWLPAGTFPLSIICNNDESTLTSGAVRVAIFLNGELYNSEWSAASASFPSAISTTLSCSSDWTAAENQIFSTELAGKFATATSVWPCAQLSKRLLLTRMVEIPNHSVTARKIDIAITATNSISARVGPFAFLKGTYSEFPMFFSIYLEPGIFPFWSRVNYGTGRKFIAALIAIDGEVISYTGDSGWLGSVGGDQNSPMFNVTQSCNFPIDPVPKKLFEVGEYMLVPDLVWANSTTCRGFDQGYFLYNIDVKPLEPRISYSKIDFIVVADDQFILQARNGPPLITSPPDPSVQNGFAYNMVQKFSLYLPKGLHRLKFSVANYFGGYGVTTRTALFVAISSNGNIISASNGLGGLWTTGWNTTVKNCTNYGYSSAIRDEIYDEFPLLPISFVSFSSSCSVVGGLVYHIYYDLELIESEPPRTVQSSEIASSTIALHMSSARDALVSVVPNNFLETIIGSKLLVIALCAATLVLICGCLVVCQIVKKQHANRTYETKTETNFTHLTTQMASENHTTETQMHSSGTTTIGMTSTVNATIVGTDMRNTFSIPGYLMMVKGEDYSITKKLTKGGGGDIYFAQAISPKLQEYGHTVIVKQIQSNTTDTEMSQAMFYQELSITSYLQMNKNIVRLLGYSENPNAILLKIYLQGSLGNRINSRPVKLSMRMAHSFLGDIANGLMAIHSAGFVHADIKSDNILIDVDRESGKQFCVICDFGITQVVEEKV
eukprot:Partr_v1_DN28863_c3_g2_i5_m33597